MIQSKSLKAYLLFTIIVGAWPFLNFPLTDGDIVNWTKVSYQMTQTGQYFSTAADQGHGPLMAWGGALSLKLFGTSFLGLNLLNLFCGLIGVLLTFKLSKLLFDSSKSASLATFIGSTIIASVYLTRTPMYDWPATMAYLGFVTWYTTYVKKGELKDLVFALMSIGIGSLSRFSICMGLAGIYVIISSLILRRSLWLLIRDGLLILASVGIFNGYWLLQQVGVQGESFLQTFIYDNTGRYVKSTRPDATFRADFYGFPLVVLVGFLPYTFALVASFFQKGIIKRFKGNRHYQLLLAAFLPCLILFSFSGHTKLARYIAYVFPFISILLADFLVQFDLSQESFRRKCKTAIKWTSVLITLLLIQQAFQFSSEAQESLLFVVSAFGLIYGLLGLGYITLCVRYDDWVNAPERFLIGFGIVYIVFFSVLAFEYKRAPFLEKVHTGIYNSITRD